MLAEIDASLEVASGDIDAVLATVGSADAILNTYLPFDAGAIARLERPRIIARYGIGVDNIDLQAARDAGIVVTNVPDYSVEEVAVHTLALMLNVARKVSQADALVRSGGWSIDELRPISRLGRLTVGLVGYGRIARRLAAPLAALGVEVVVHDPYVTPAPGGPAAVELDRLLAEADIVSIHVPLTDETRGLIDRAALETMKRTAVLINASRGPLVVFDDLADALTTGTIAGAALDVFDVEPLPPSRLAGIPNLIVTPHMAYYSEEALTESQTKATTQVIKVLTGREPDYRVNPA